MNVECENECHRRLMGWRDEIAAHESGRPRSRVVMPVSLRILDHIRTQQGIYVDLRPDHRGESNFFGETILPSIQAYATSPEHELKLVKGLHALVIQGETLPVDIPFLDDTDIDFSHVVPMTRRRAHVQLQLVR